LKEYHNRWYLIALEVGNNKIRTFGLERIESIETGEKKFTIDKSFDADTFFKHSIGITERAEKPQEVVLSFDTVSGQFLKTQPVHSSQAIIKEGKNEIQIGLKVLITQELITFILGYGAQVKVMKPSLLAKEVAKQLKDASDLYK